MEEDLNLHYTSTTEILFSYQQGLRKINQSITSAKKYILLEYRETATAIGRKKKGFRKTQKSNPEMRNPGLSLR